MPRLALPSGACPLRVPLAVNRHRIWRKRLWRISPRCLFCGCQFAHYDDATLEHLVPKMLGGTNAWDNLALTCHRCNQQRAKWFSKNAALLAFEFRLRKKELELIRERAIRFVIRRAIDGNQQQRASP